LPRPSKSINPHQKKAEMVNKISYYLVDDEVGLMTEVLRRK